MRKSFYLASAAIVATMLFSCAKVEEKSLSSEKGTLKVELTASTDTPATKVTIGAKDGTKYPVTWDAEGETVTMIEVRHGEQVNESSISSEEEYTLSQDKKTAKFSFNLEEANADSYDYLFVYPASTGFNKTQDPMTLTLSLPLSQTSAQNSADPKAVFLFSSVMGKTSQQTSFSTNFEAISAIGKMTLKNLPIEAGEKIENVSITAEGKDLSGKSWYVYENGTFNHATSGANNKVSVDVKSITTSSDFTFWFSCWPCSFAAGDKLTIVATTDKTTYTREITMTAKELKAGNVNTIAVNMSSAVKPTTNETFTLTSLDAIQESDVVVIAMKKGDKYYAMTNDKGTSSPAAVLTDVKSNTVKNPGADLRWNISSSDAGYFIRPAGDATKNLYSTNSNSGVKVGTTEGTWVLEGDYLKFTKEFTDDKDNPIFRYLGVYFENDSPKDWRTYSSTTGNIKDQQVCFFAFSDSRTPQNLSFPEASYTAELGKAFNAPTVSGVQTTATYSSSNEAVATVNESTGAVTLVAAGTTTITAKAEANATYKAGTASYTLTVTSATALQTMDEIFAAATTAGSTATAVKVKFNNWVISGIKGNSNAYATDGTKGFIIYNSNHGFAAGDKLSGTVTCKVQLYNGSAELTDITSSSEGLTVTKGGTLTAQNATIAELSGVNTGAYFNLGTLTYDGTNFTDGTNTIQPYGNGTTLPELKSGTNYKVKGMYLQFKTTKEIVPLYATDFEEAGAPDPTCATPVITIDGSGKATITCETSGATIKYAIADTEPASFANTYSTPVQLTDGQTIWAKASATGIQDSKVASKKYTAGESTINIIEAAGITASVTLNDDNNPYEMGNTGITLTGTKGNTNFPALNYNATKGTDLRFYKGTTCGVTFAIDGGRKISKIEFLKNATTASILGSSFSVNTGTLTDNVWEGEASSITFSYSNSSDNFKEQMYIINVTYK